MQSSINTYSIIDHRIRLLDPIRGISLSGIKSCITDIHFVVFNHLNHLLQAVPATFVVCNQAEIRPRIPLSNDKFRNILGLVMLVQILGFIQSLGYGNAGTVAEGLYLSLGNVIEMITQLTTLSSVTVKIVTVGGNLATITTIGISAVIAIHIHCRDGSFVRFAEISGG